MAAILREVFDVKGEDFLQVSVVIIVFKKCQSRYWFDNVRFSWFLVLGYIYALVAPPLSS